MEKNNYLKKVLQITLIIIALCIVSSERIKAQETVKTSWWSLQAIDTVKYSRDIAREKANDDSFTTFIDDQVKVIYEAGATHIAIGTPYDEEFIPFMKRWVTAARKYDLNIWFRGNFSGWEEWFGYNRIGREDHKRLLKEFIETNGDLFEDGDVFTTCSECENGGPGDPRATDDVQEYRKFLTDEYRISKEAFRKIGKNVESNYFSMNADVARLVMNPETTKSVGGIVVIDHYVGTPTQLAGDIKAISKLSGGRIVLGEFGAPIPDIHGNMSEEEQAVWIDNALHQLSPLPELVGINYWTALGGTTAIWNDNFEERKAVSVIKKYFNPKIFGGMVLDEAGGVVRGAVVQTPDKTIVVSDKGNFLLPYFEISKQVTVKASGYTSVQILAEESENQKIILKREKETVFFKIKKFFFQLFN